MKKILSVALVLCMMISLCSVFALMPVSAADDEYTPGAAWTVTGTSASGTGRISGAANGEKSQENGYFIDDGTDVPEEQRRTKEEKIEDLVSVWDKGIGAGNGGFDKDGNFVSMNKTSVVYSANDPGVLLTGSVNSYWAGFWCEALGASVPTCKWPITFDVDFGGNVETSGVRLHKGENANGLIQKYEVYVQFPDAGDDEWTYICTDGNLSKDLKINQDLVTPFGQNLVIKKLRIRVLESSTANVKKNEFATYNGGSYEGAEYAYFQLRKIGILKPYNNGGSTYTNWLPSTATSVDELDEYTFNKEDLTGGFIGDNYSLAQIRNMMDGDLSTVCGSNGSFFANLNDEVEVSGLRFYPVKDCNYASIGKNNHSLKTFEELAYLTAHVTLSGGTTDIRVDSNSVNGKKVTVLSKKNCDYPTFNSAPDYTKPVTVYFPKNIKIKGYMINGWTMTNGSLGHAGFAEVKLLKPKIVISNPDMEVHTTVSNDVKFEAVISDSITASLSDVLDSEGTSIGASNFEYDSATTSFVIKESYVETLTAGKHTFAACFTNGDKIIMTINRRDVTSQDYYITSTDGTRRGTTDLVLNTIGGKEIKSVKYSESNGSYVIAIGEKKDDKYKLPFTYQYDRATVKIYDFRDNLDIFLACEEVGKAYVDVTFADDTTETYTINLKNPAHKLTATINTAEFRADEIVATNDWSMKFDTQTNNSSSQNILNPWSGSLSPSASAPYALWHTGYTVVNGSAV